MRCERSDEFGRTASAGTAIVVFYKYLIIKKKKNCASIMDTSYRGKKKNLKNNNTSERFLGKFFIVFIFHQNDEK